MFSEGECFNEWHLRPLKKGTARLAFSSWEEGIDLKVLPVGINYSSYRRFGKNIFLNFGSVLSKEQFDQDSEGKKYNAFTDRLRIQLSRLVYEIPKGDKSAQKKLTVETPALLKSILLLPAILGWILNAPLYLPLYSYTVKTLKDDEFHDAVLTGLLVFIYPVYLLVFALIIFLISHSGWSFSVFFVFPFTAWAYTRLKPQLDK